MSIKKFELPTFAIVADARFFEGKRQATLDAIDNWNMPKSIDTDESKISKSDYPISANVFRPYSNIVSTVVDDIVTIIENEFGWRRDWVMPQNVWFQQYEGGDSHSWHTHPHSTFNCVWYVELPDGAPATTILTEDGEIDVEVKQGDVLIFPAQYLHKSSSNESDGRKTVVVLNI